MKKFRLFSAIIILLGSVCQISCKKESVERTNSQNYFETSQIFFENLVWKTSPADSGIILEVPALPDNHSPNNIKAVYLWHTGGTITKCYPNPLFGIWGGPEKICNTTETLGYYTFITKDGFEAGQIYYRVGGKSIILYIKNIDLSQTDYKTAIETVKIIFK